MIVPRLTIVIGLLAAIVALRGGIACANGAVSVHITNLPSG